MGMFDYLQCDHPLPDGRVEPGAVWQTKDGPCEMGLVLITDDGWFKFEVRHIEIVPEEERPNWGKPEWNRGGIFQMMGSMRSVVDGHTVRGDTFSVNFYRSRSLDPRIWEEYRAEFIDGRLRTIESVPTRGET